MSIMRHVFAVKICVRSPFIFADVDASGIGIDTPALRNSDDQAIMPADHFKGLLREAWCALNAKVPQPSNEGDLFGSETTKNNAYQPERGKVLFSDMVQNEDKYSGHLTRIRIDENTGTVMDGMLEVIELTRPLGDAATFVGQIIWHGEVRAAQELRTSLQMALRIIPYFGGARSAGFGEHVREKSSIGAPVPETLSKPIAVSAGKTYQVRAQFDRPIAVNVTQLASNIFEGGTVVPGSAIKGALADMLAAGGRVMSPTVSAALSAMRISHAFAVAPESGKLLDRALPLSHVVFESDPKFHSQLGKGDDAGFDATMGVGSFLPDAKGKQWSNFRKQLDRCGSHFPQWALGHTKISPELGSAEDRKLFVTMAVDTTAHRYQFQIQLPDKAAAADIEHIMQTLHAGLDNIGKTAARMVKVEISSVNPVKPTAASEIAIMLETPALFVIPKDGVYQEDPSMMLARYFKHFNLDLKDHFCQRRLVGGYPVLRAKGLKSYRPLTLYSEGSCFELNGEVADIENFSAFANTGLPVLREDQNDQLNVETDWKSCLYLPQNGYGEISVNPDFLVQS